MADQQTGVVATRRVRLQEEHIDRQRNLVDTSRLVALTQPLPTSSPHGALSTLNRSQEPMQTRERELATAAVHTTNL